MRSSRVACAYSLLVVGGGASLQVLGDLHWSRAAPSRSAVENSADVALMLARWSCGHARRACSGSGVGHTLPSGGGGLGSASGAFLRVLCSRSQFAVMAASVVNGLLASFACLGGLTHGIVTLIAPVVCASLPQSLRMAHGGHSSFALAQFPPCQGRDAWRPLGSNMLWSCRVGRESTKQPPRRRDEVSRATLALWQLFAVCARVRHVAHRGHMGILVRDPPRRSCTTLRARLYVMAVRFGEACRMPFVREVSVDANSLVLDCGGMRSLEIAWCSSAVQFPGTWLCRYTWPSSGPERQGCQLV